MVFSWKLIRISRKNVYEKTVVMKNCKIILIVFGVFICISFTNCYKSKNEAPVNTVVMLGNSITFSPQWGSRGVASSVKDSDYVHLLIRDIHQFNPSVAIKYGNIAEFERNFDTYPLSKLDGSLKGIAKFEDGVETYPLHPGIDSIRNPDMLILKIAENVNDEKAIQDDFIKYYDNLIKYICPNKKTRIIIVDGFWANKNVNRLIEEYATKKGYPFVSIKELSKDITNMATGQYEDKGIAAHPSDKGMRMIEQRIWSSIKKYFVGI